MTYSSRHDLAGRTFGRLTVISLHATGGRGRHSRWLCRCICGNETVVTSNNLKCGGTISCGCLQKELAAAKRKTHGMTHHPLFNSWQQMNGRCYNENNHNYANYGARGVGVHEEWRHSFPSFLEHVSMLPNYEKEGFSLDRINNNGNYCPGNVQWATSRQQNRNNRNTRSLIHDGRIQGVSAWAEEYNLKPSILYHRLQREWDIERALTTPARKWRRTHAQKKD